MGSPQIDGPETPRAPAGAGVPSSGGSCSFVSAHSMASGPAEADSGGRGAAPSPVKMITQKHNQDLVAWLERNFPGGTRFSDLVANERRICASLSLVELVRLWGPFLVCWYVVGGCIDAFSWHVINVILIFFRWGRARGKPSPQRRLALDCITRDPTARRCFRAHYRATFPRCVRCPFGKLVDFFYTYREMLARVGVSEHQGGAGVGEPMPNIRDAFTNWSFRRSSFLRLESVYPFGGIIWGATQHVSPSEGPSCKG